MKPPAATALGLKDGDHVDFDLDSPRPVTFRNVKVRVAETADNFMHIDYDEANAAGVTRGMFGFIRTTLSGRTGI
jgi:propanediol utilization protein